MLLKKDGQNITSKAQLLNRKKPAQSKSPANTKSNDQSHLTTDNVLHHICKLKYPSIGGTPKGDG